MTTMKTAPLTPLANGKFNGVRGPSITPKNGRLKPKANGSILSFFKKTEPGSEPNQSDIDELFVRGDGHGPETAIRDVDDHTNGSLGTSQEKPAQLYSDSNEASIHARFHENGDPVKRRKTSHFSDGTAPVFAEEFQNDNTSQSGWTSPSDEFDGKRDLKPGREEIITYSQHAGTSSGPFVDKSDDEDDVTDKLPAGLEEGKESGLDDECATEEADKRQEDVKVPRDDDAFDPHSTGEQALVHTETPEERPSDEQRPISKGKSTGLAEDDGFADFEALGDFEDEYEEGEEFTERRWQMEQQGFESSVGFEGELPNDELLGATEGRLRGGGSGQVESESGLLGAQSCPICGVSFAGISDQDASVHVNNCLDGNPSPLPTPMADIKKELEEGRAIQLQKVGRFPRPAKPGQENPFNLAVGQGSSSAFSKLMSGHNEEAAWATAAAAENASRGKPTYQRTCPFYKILPGLFTCVDAFRYGAVEGCNAYFLSHFHSDHYIGLTSNWGNGPIYCSRVTANLVRQQLRVDPKWVKPLEFEEKVEVPNTGGVHVTMIPANHCPGSSLYLFEKIVGKGKSPRVQRVLHCGDFRACPAHIEHPLLKPEVMDMVTGKTAQQKIDVCYLDTTYLNPKYAFPSQEDVIAACADMCVSLNKTKADDKDGYEQMKRERAGGSMAKFVRKDSKDEEDSVEAGELAKKKDGQAGGRGSLLVVVGTYSIGKERICLGIARALNSKIYAPQAKQRICAALEDPELNARLTSDPRAAQVHMTPLFEIRAETLCEYLEGYSDRFSRAVGFRPSGWNYRPPGSRFTDSPAVGAVLYSDNWKSSYSMRELVPQRGSTSKVSSFGVPYSEHSSFRELTLFCCALRIEKIIPTVNVGSAKSRERMKMWCDRWAMEKKKNGLFRLKGARDDPGNGFYPGKGTWELKTTL